MADQSAPPAAPAGAAPADPSIVARLHEHAVQAEKHVEQLATGLGQVGADDSVVKGVSQMADVLRRVAKGLGGSAIKSQARPQSQAPGSIDEAANQMMAERGAPGPRQ